MAEKLKDIGSILQEARTSRGFTQADIAPQLGVSRATVAQIETGRRSLKAEDLTRLAAFYGCSLSELLPPATDDQEEVEGLAELFRSHPDLAEDQGPSSLVGACVIARALTDMEERLEIDAVRPRRLCRPEFCRFRSLNRITGFLSWSTRALVSNTAASGTHTDLPTSCSIPKGLGACAMLADRLTLQR